MSELIDISSRYINCQMNLAEKNKKEGQSIAVRPFITISRQTGAGGITVGRCLVDYLTKHDAKAICPWTVFDKDMVEAVLQEHQLSEKFAEFMPEAKVSEIRDMVENLFGLHPPQWTLVQKTSQTIIRLANLGNVILVGRGANILTRKFQQGFHVRLMGSYEKRLEHIKAYYHLDLEEAKKKIKTEDQGRKDYLKDHFNQDIDNPLIFDLVINTDHVPYKEAAVIVGENVLRRDREWASRFS